MREARDVFCEWAPPTVFYRLMFSSQVARVAVVATYRRPVELARLIEGFVFGA